MFTIFKSTRRTRVVTSECLCISCTHSFYNDPVSEYQVLIFKYKTPSCSVSYFSIFLVCKFVGIVVNGDNHILLPVQRGLEEDSPLTLSLNHQDSWDVAPQGRQHRKKKKKKRVAAGPVSTLCRRFYFFKKLNFFLFFQVVEQLILTDYSLSSFSSKSDTNAFCDSIDRFSKYLSKYYRLSSSLASRNE